MSFFLHKEVFLNEEMNEFQQKVTAHCWLWWTKAIKMVSRLAITKCDEYCMRAIINRGLYIFALLSKKSLE